MDLLRFQNLRKKSPAPISPSDVRNVALINKTDQFV